MTDPDGVQGLELFYDEKTNAILESLQEALTLALAERSLVLKMVPEEFIKIERKLPMVRGGYASVFCGRLDNHSERVAIKQILPGGDPESRLRVEVAFARELKVWEGLSHPNLLPLLAFRIDSEQAIMQFISPYASHGNVKGYFKWAKSAENEPDMTTRLQLLLDTLNGLSYLHKKQTCHGDLKGENILIFFPANRPIAKLCDFGLSKIEDDMPSGLTTVSFYKKGTPLYLSPELLTSDMPKRDFRSDVWAWGCVVLEIVNNKVPYESTNKHLIQGQIRDGVHPATGGELPSHEGLRRILKQCWEKDPEKRPTAFECRDELIGLVAEEVPLPGSPTMGGSSMEYLESTV